MISLLPLLSLAIAIVVAGVNSQQRLSHDQLLRWSAFYQYIILADEEKARKKSIQNWTGS